MTSYNLKIFTIMPRTPEQYEEIRNEKKKVILDAAMKLFACKGYASTSISSIADEANISKGLMYNYFKSKEELLKTILQNFINEIAEMMDSNHDNRLSKEEAFQFLDNYFELLMTRTEEAKLFAQLTVQPEVLQFFSENTMPMTKQGELLVSCFSEIQKENIDMRILDFTAIIKGITILYVFEPEKYPDERMLQYKEHLKNKFFT